MFTVFRNLGVAVAEHTKLCRTLVFPGDTDMEPESVCSFTDILLLGSLSLLRRWQANSVLSLAEVDPSPHLPVRHCLVRVMDLITECSFKDNLSDLRHLSSPIDGQVVLT